MILSYGNFTVESARKLGASLFPATIQNSTCPAVPASSDTGFIFSKYFEAYQVKRILQKIIVSASELSILIGYLIAPPSRFHEAIPFVWHEKFPSPNAMS